MSTLNVDKVDPSTGTALEIGTSGDTITVPSGATFVVAGTTEITGTNNVQRPNANPLIINGDCSVAQRGTSTASITGTTDDYYTCDRWAFQVNDSSVWTQSQDTDVPSGYGFGKSIKLDCTTLDATPTFTVLQQKLEGQNLQLLKKGTANAESLTLSFWVKSVKTGTYICELRDYDNNRTISKAYTVDSGSTWEQKFLNFAGDTTGALDDDNAASLAVTFFLAVSSTYSSGTLATSWESRTNANRAVGQVNLSDSTSNDFWLTAVQLEVGEYTSSTLPPFQHESYGDNLARCQRYYQTFGRGFIGKSQSSSTGTMVMTFPVHMRATPTCTVVTGSDTIANPGVAAYEITSITGNSSGPQGLYLAINTNGGSSGTFYLGTVDNVGDADAEI